MLSSFSTREFEFSQMQTIHSYHKSHDLILNISFLIVLGEMKCSYHIALKGNKYVHFTIECI